MGTHTCIDLSIVRKFHKLLSLCPWTLLFENLRKVDFTQKWNHIFWRPKNKNKINDIFLYKASTLLEKLFRTEIRGNLFYNIFFSSQNSLPREKSS